MTVGVAAVLVEALYLQPVVSVPQIQSLFVVLVSAALTDGASSPLLSVSALLVPVMK